MPDPRKRRIFDIFFYNLSTTTTTSNMSQMDAALLHLKGLKHTNYRKVAKEFNVEETTLRRRFLGLTVSHKVHAETTKRALNRAQENAVLGYIDLLTDKHIPPTVQIIQNLAEELIGHRLGKNWSSTFCQRYKDRICSVYLRPLDRARVAAENDSMFEHFYSLVLL